MDGLDEIASSLCESSSEGLCESSCESSCELSSMESSVSSSERRRRGRRHRVSADGNISGYAKKLSIEDLRDIPIPK